MENLGLGLAITVVGMGIVFGLLALLWALLTLALRLERRAAGRAAPEPVPATPGSGPAAPAGGSPAAPAPGTAAPAAETGTSPVVRLSGVPADLDPRLVAAIAVVIGRHVETRRRQAAPAMRSYWPGSLLFASRWVSAGRMRQTQSWRRRGR